MSAPMEDLAQNLLSALKKPSVPVDSKLTLFNNLKSSIKHQRISESAQPPTVECVRLAIASQTSSTLVSTGFSTLSHLIKRLTLQDQVNAIFSPRINILGALLDRLGDSKESHRTAASQCLTELWPARSVDVEKMIREGAVSGTNVRAKDTGMQWVVKMHAEQALPFKSFVPPFIECLDHSDGTIRERAKHGLVDLFRDSPDHAKADLKRQLVAKDVRKSIASHILSQLHIPMPSEFSSSAAPAQPAPRPETPYHEPTAEPQEILLPPSQEATHIEPLYISSQRELDETFRQMQPYFEGRESEANWMARDNSILKLRRYLNGNAPEEYQTAFVGHIKHMLDSILKVANSLRTTMSTNGCHLVQELARTLGPAIDPMVELLMQNMMKLCSATKNIAAQNGNTTVDVLLSHVSYNVRLVQHVWQAVQDKNTQPRTFAASWLKTLMRRQTHNKVHFEHSGGLELVEKSIKKGLADANPKVRETMRGAFWAFEHIWHDRGEVIMDALDAKSRQLLEKDPANPNASQSSFTSSVGPGATNPRAAASSARTALKDTIAAQKKAALVAKRMPDRPSSAMATLSPAKEATRPAARSANVGNSSTTRVHPSSSTLGPSTRPNAAASSGTNHGSLMSGPVRRPKRPEVARPATADPYANRRLLRAESPPSRGSENSPTRSASKSSAASSNQTQNRMQPSSRPGTSGTDVSSRVASPRVSPTKQRPRTIHGADPFQTSTPKSRHVGKLTSPASADQRTNSSVKHRDPAPNHITTQRFSVEQERPMSNHSPEGNAADEDNFTLVMPPKFTNTANEDMLHGVVPQNDDAMSKVSVNSSPHQRTPVKALSSSSSRERVVDSNRKDEIEVHEDPSAREEAPGAEEPPQEVLQELAMNEQSLAHTATNTDDEHDLRSRDEDIRSVSPTKNGIALSIEGSNSDRAEIMKNRRILSSGIERLRAKTLDAHGFRRLQDLVKLPSHDSAKLMSEVLVVLIGYIEAAPEALRVNNMKAISLKCQALATMRSVAALHKHTIEVREEFARAVCATLTARRIPPATPHFAAELERTAAELVKVAGAQVGDVLDAVLDFVDRQSAGRSDGQASAVPMALGVLSRLQIAMREQSRPPTDTQKRGLGKLTVRFLEDRNPDVRRADTELCLEMFEHFGDAHKDEYWSLLRGAQDAQLNLVAYYLARRKAQDGV